eukprot:5535252-Amphidinium_carterae.1
MCKGIEALSENADVWTTARVVRCRQETFDFDRCCRADGLGPTGCFHTETPLGRLSLPYVKTDCCNDRQAVLRANTILVMVAKAADCLAGCSWRKRNG